MPMKILLGLVITAIILSLIMAGFYMLKSESKDRGRQMANALTVRIGLSVVLFVCLLLLWRFGFIAPTGYFPIAH